jgi:hypothetical protein
VAAAPVEKLKNANVVSLEFKLKPGEAAAVDGRPAAAVFFSDGALELSAPGEPARKSAFTRGDVVFQSGKAGTVKNVGSAEIDFVRTEFLTDGSGETWGTAGLSPNYKLLIENRYTRVYDIRIPAHTREPQHTHRARVVVCLSGAELKHLMPDGREEPSTLRTGEVAWRLGATHIGQNLGDTDLWVIAIEPK